MSLILLDLATGRDPTDFPGVLHNPETFLPSVLPLSRVANELLLRTMLGVNWRTRITLPEVRRAVKMMDMFDGILSKGSMALHPRKARMDLDSDEEELVNDIDETAADD